MNTGIQFLLFRNEISHHSDVLQPYWKEPIRRQLHNHTYIQIETTFRLRATPKRKCRQSDETPAIGRTRSCQNDTSRYSQRRQSHKNDHTPPQWSSLQASLSSLVGTSICHLQQRAYLIIWSSAGILLIASLHAFQSRFFGGLFYKQFHETDKPRTCPRPQGISWNRGKFRAGPA